MKRFLSLICILSVLLGSFIFAIPVKADFPVGVPGYSELKELQKDVQNGDNRTLKDIWNTLQPVGEAVGVIMNPIQRIEFIRDIVDPAVSNLPDYPTNGTQQEKDNFVSQYLIDNTTFNDQDKSYTLNQNAKNIVNGVVNNYINETGYIYVYSFNLIDSLNSVNNGNYYNGLRKLLNEKQDEFICIIGSLWYSSSNIDAYLFRKDNMSLVLNSILPSYNLVQADIYNNTSWLPNSTCDIYRYNHSSYEFELYQSNFNFSGVHPAYQIDISKKTSPSSYGYCYFTVGRYDTMICYRTLNDLKQDSEGIKSYYINNSVYNDFSTSSGDFTIDSSNSNNASYGDISNYINSFNNETGTYPTPTDIDIFIENYDPSVNPTPTPNPDNPSGGGSSSSNASATANNQGVNVTVNNNHSINFTVPSLSGNGTSSGSSVSGNGSGSGNFFDWLGNLGSIIGNLIKGIGEALVGIFEGVAEAVTTIMESIPNILSPLMEFVFGGLPDEIKALMTLGITCVIFVGVIKAIKR